MQRRDNRAQASKIVQMGQCGSGGEPATSPLTSRLGDVHAEGCALAPGSLMGPRAPNESASAANAARRDINHNADKVHHKDKVMKAALKQGAGTARAASGRREKKKDRNESRMGV